MRTKILLGLALVALTGAAGCITSAGAAKMIAAASKDTNAVSFKLTCSFGTLEVNRNMPSQRP